MIANIYFYNTLILSIIVQFVVGLLEVGTLLIKVPPAQNIIRQLLVLEVIVQVVEGLFYVWLVYNISKVTNITPKRYVDWLITTPTMLITLIVYLIYLRHKEKNEDTSRLELVNTLYKNSTVISYVIFLNWLMLLFGYLGETKVINTFFSVILGFVPFFIYYYMIYVNYAVESKTGLAIFWYFVFFWSLYGVAATLPYNIKNSMYNILDLFAKNFFGLFLSYIIITKKY